MKQTVVYQYAQIYYDKKCFTFTSYMQSCYVTHTVMHIDINEVRSHNHSKSYYTLLYSCSVHDVVHVQMHTHMETEHSIIPKEIQEKLVQEMIST